MRFHLGLLLAVCCATLPAAESFAPLALRGFGTVSSTYRSEAAGSVLEITCEDEAKAKLIQAKYLADLAVLGGVERKPGVGKGPTVFQVAGQGFVAAVGAAKQVSILTASGEPGMQTLCKTIRSAGASTAQVEVPMWLDRWDRHGFRFYYWPWAILPPGGKWGSYDITAEFPWAQAMGDSGFTVWAHANMGDTAEGMTQVTEWEWIERWAKAKGLSVGINLSVENASTPKWICDRYREQLMMKMPQFTGGYRHGDNALGMVPWGFSEAEEARLAVMQTIVKRFAPEPNVVKWMEPHNELQHHQHDILCDYGPASDTIYRTYLKGRYPSPAELGKAWFQDAKRLASWDDVHVPELAEFFGWGAEALDLSGVWKVRYPEDPTQVDEAWFTGTSEDAEWCDVAAPGNDRAFFFPRKYAVYRRSFPVEQAWLGKHPRTWLYVWDLNGPGPQHFVAWLNGQQVADEDARPITEHWAAVEVTQALSAGANRLALGLPQGQIRYRVYLSPVPPKAYPDLGPGLNARWYDFCAWRQWARVLSVQRGMEAIRQLDPNRQIDLASPSAYTDGIKDLAERGGGQFKDTGFLQAVWNDTLPKQMRGSGLPFAVETGGSDESLDGFKTTMGRYATEGIQGVDYYIHIGAILWNPEMKQHFESIQPLVRLFGTYHVPKAEVAILASTQATEMNEWPWYRGAAWAAQLGVDCGANLPAGSTFIQLADALTFQYPRDALTEGDFARGNAARYKAIIDTNTSTMDDALLAGIESYVRGGGTFVTFYHSGRHSPAVANAWPISRLTGYDVAAMESFDERGELPASAWHGLKLAPGQEVFKDAGWTTTRATGLHLAKKAGDAKDLALWDDGTVAVGMRQLGKGCIIQVGCRWDAKTYSNSRVAVPFFSQILDWRQVARIPAELAGDARGNGYVPWAVQVIWRHYVSNNGLYDIWALWNQDKTADAQVELRFRDGVAPTTARDVGAGKDLVISNGTLADIALEPLQTRVFLTPRGRLASSAKDWFALQRYWWRGTGLNTSKPFPAPTNRFSQPLDEGWSWKAVGAGDRPEDWAQPGFDAAKWEQKPLGIWDQPDRPDVKDAFMRKTFTTNPAWKGGRIALWMQTWTQGGGMSNAQQIRVWLDGKPVRNWGWQAVQGDDFASAFTPGSTHTVACELKGPGTLHGLTGDCWLSYVPTPLRAIDLGGTWTATQDFQQDAGTVELPGSYSSVCGMRREIVVPDSEKGLSVLLSVASARGSILGAIVNGSYVRRHHHRNGNRWNLNITPWIRFGQANQIELVTNPERPDDGQLEAVSLDLYPKNTYP